MKVKNTKRFFSIMSHYCLGCGEEYYFEIMWRITKAGSWSEKTYCKRCYDKLGEVKRNVYKNDKNGTDTLC